MDSSTTKPSMEEENETQRKAFAETLKVALAMSIIRSKPEGVTSKEYAQQLAIRLKETDSSWKTKYKDMETVLKKAQQEIVMLRLKVSSKSDDQRLTVEQMQSDTESSTKNSVVEFKTHGDFLRTVLSIGNWYDRLQDDASCLTTIKSSFKYVLTDLEAALKEVALNEHEISLVENSSKYLSGMMKVKDFCQDKNIKEICNSIIRTMVTKIMNAHPVQGKRLNSALSASLLLFCQSSPMICENVVAILVRVIAGFTNLLKDLSSFTNLNVSKYQNICYICNILHDVIVKAASHINASLFDQYAVMLDKNLFGVSNQFSMYTHMVWKLSSMMSMATLV
ncbi:meiosis-specific protein MEI4-like [Clytia hemisphaerica]|uniref:Uncharacterized protein n=1 Tax=Clytia hemisphaerica TaxID=252671 RepID=A0A7M5UN31_9CNID